MPQAASAALVSRFRDSSSWRGTTRPGPDIHAHRPQLTRQRGQRPAGRCAPGVRPGLADRGDGGRQVLGQPGPADPVADVCGHPVVGREGGVLVRHAAWVGGPDQMGHQIARRPRPGQAEDHRGPAADPAPASLAGAAEAESGQQQGGRDGDERPAQDPAGQRGRGGPVGAAARRGWPSGRGLAAGWRVPPASPGARSAGPPGPGGPAERPGSSARSADDGTGSPAHTRAQTP